MFIGGHLELNNVKGNSFGVKNKLSTIIFSLDLLHFNLQLDSDR